jgi:hypothetical protein
MKDSKFLDVLAGVILGVIFGIIYYGMPARCLITGPMQIEGLFIPQELNRAILLLTLKWGGGIGAVIGFFGGLGTPITMPRGHMSKSISCICFLVCTIAAFVMYGSQLWHMAGYKIGITLFYVFLFFVMAVPFGSSLGFIEKIRE